MDSIGVEFSDKTMTVGDTRVKLQCWDTAGDARFKSMVKQYFRDKAACVIVFDVTDRQSFAGVDAWIDDLRLISHPDAVIVMVGNKVDCDRCVDREMVEKVANSKNVVYFECSAKTGTNVEEMFSYLATEIVEKIKSGKINVKDDSTGIRKQGVSKGSNMLSMSTFKSSQSQDDSILNKAWTFLCPKKNRS